jgi:hypothetical protein
LTDQEDLLLRSPIPQDAKSSDFPRIIRGGEDVQVFDEDDGSLIAYYVDKAFDEELTSTSFEFLKDVQGDATVRGEVTGGHHALRLRADNTTSNIREATPEQVAKYAYAQADYLGYMDATSRRPFCRSTAWTRANPEILRGVYPLIEAADTIFKELLPTRHAAQLNHVSESPDFQIGTTCVTTLTVNRDLPPTYHRDEGDYPEGYGMMITLGEFTGCELGFPMYGIGFDYHPGSLLLANVHLTHGGLPQLSGTRLALVLYARTNIHVCGSAEEEEAKMRGKMSIHARED